MNPIDYALAGDAISHYRGAGFRYVEAPWSVSSQAIEITIPRDHDPMMVWHPTLTEGFLVGSAEQGFLQMMLDGAIPSGRYVAAGPCWRDDPVDEWHQRYFFKVELIDIASPRGVFEPFHVEQMVDAARSFMKERCGTGVIETVKTDEGFDLTLNGIEVGSYGHRRHDKLDWIYGTGLALPRFSMAKALNPKPNFDWLTRQDP